MTNTCKKKLMLLAYVLNQYYLLIFLSVCAAQVSQDVSHILGHLQFWESAAHGSGSWRVGTAMAWQHQTCFLACRAWMFQHALLGAVQQNPPLGRHPHGAPTLHAPGLTHWSAVGGQTGPKRQWKVPAKYINDVFDMYCQCIRDVSIYNAPG